MSVHEAAATHFSYHARLGLVGLYMISSSLAVYSFRQSSPGWGRAHVTCATILCNLIAPLLFHHDEEIVAMSQVIFMLGWLGSFKVLGWCCGRGPLALDLSLPQLIVTLCMPITPVLKSVKASQRITNARQGEVGESAGSAAINFVMKLIGLVAVVTLLQSPNIPRLIQEILYLLGAYSFLGIVQQCVSVFTILLLGMSVAPHFDKPFLSSSLADFWSRRWNLNTGYTLRFMIYDPIMDGQLTAKPAPPAVVPSAHGGRALAVGGAPPPRARRFAATCAAFVGSGIMHEVFIVYVKGRVSWYWLAFFSLQGPLVCAESLLRGWARRRGLAVPRAAATAATLAVLLALADALFFYDIVRMGIPQRVVANIYAVIPRAAPWPTSTQ